MKALAPTLFGLCYILSAHFAYGSACSGTMNSWMMSGNQSPCDIYQSLIRLCIPTFAVGILSYGQQYETGPESCGCNTVAASLVAACSDCQNSATYDGPLYSWYLTANTDGTNNCTSITNGSISTSVSVPDSLRADIPTWAYIDINLVGGFWSYSYAHTVAFNGSLSSSLSTSTDSETISAASVTIQTVTPTASVRTQTVMPTASVITQTVMPTASVITQTITVTAFSASSVQIGAVVGGVVAGILVLVGAVAIALLWMRKKKKESSDKALSAQRETPAMSHYSQSQPPTTPDYEYFDSTIERSSRPAALERTYASSAISSTFAASEPLPLTYSPPPPAYSPPPPPTNANGYYHYSSNEPDFMTTYRRPKRTSFD